MENEVSIQHDGKEFVGTYVDDGAMVTVYHEDLHRYTQIGAWPTILKHWLSSFFAQS